MSATVTVESQANRRHVDTADSRRRRRDLPQISPAVEQKSSGSMAEIPLSDRPSQSAATGRVGRQLFADSPSSTAPATACIEVRRSIAVRWIQRKASGSVIF